MADGLQKLLMYIVEHPLMQSESREAQLDATAVQDVPAELASISENQKADAQRLASYFAQGLKQAAANGGKLTVDDTSQEGDGIADAFARFLVTTNLATSESSTLSEGHYRYMFSVDMAQLRTLAGKAGVDLQAALRE